MGNLQDARRDRIHDIALDASGVQGDYEFVFGPHWATPVFSVAESPQFVDDPP